jgi:hypothetical protein
VTVLLSRSEIKSVVEKAIRGVGLDWGRAKDGGVMAAWLAGHDQVFLGSLLRCLDYLDNGNADSGDMKFGPIDSLLLAEHVIDSDQSWTGVVMAPRYLIAAMGLLAEEQRSALTLFDGDAVVAIADQGQVCLNSGIKHGDAEVTLSSGVAVKIKPNFTALNWSEQTAHEVSAECWARLGKLAWRVYVEETEEKRRSGAGAGDIDNS